MMNVKLKSTILLLLTAMIWGFAFVAQRVGADYLGAFSYNGIRFTLGALSLIPVIFIFEKEKKDPAKLKHTIICGIGAGAILYAASSLQQFGIVITQSAGKAGFITCLYTVLVPIFGFLFFRHKTGILTWIGALLAIIGLFLLSINTDISIGMGDIVLLIGACFWAFHILFIDHFGGGVSSVKFSMVQFFTCSALCMISALFIGEEITLNAVKMSAIPLLYGGVMSAGVAYTLQVIGQKNADPTYAAIICSTESVFSAIGGAIILKETMSLRGYIGCALMFFGIITSQLKPKKIKNG